MTVTFTTFSKKKEETVKKSCRVVGGFGSNLSNMQTVHYAAFFCFCFMFAGKKKKSVQLFPIMLGWIFLFFYILKKSALNYIKHSSNFVKVISWQIGLFLMFRQVLTCHCWLIRDGDNYTIIRRCNTNSSNYTVFNTVNSFVTRLMGQNVAHFLINGFCPLQKQLVCICDFYAKKKESVIKTPQHISAVFFNT